MTETASTTDTAKTTTQTGSSSENENSPTALLTAGAWIKKGRETKQAKAIRLLTTGRLRVFQVNAQSIAAECKGDSGELYRLGWNHGRWTCSCPARVDCSHLLALWCVTAVTR